MYFYELNWGINKISPSCLDTIIYLEYYLNLCCIHLYIINVFLL
ncbi:putative membrane protein [Methanobacterium formicicum]|uniref:Putative membrane protein n=1 Tax=Methanobacterium formicicum TaxID=2162 RepID=A0A089ZDJ6_METFO|nr:hypothetical protein BRM9_0062 [Methanobacterium formicicum]CEA13714.1 putative membrane protein [Methanobacterium formicicum]CEL23680.1 putative membrane protein [Methanobacterium formicicum]